ncbi:hypothetical protein F3Y22_tig00110637pilonHSYRG00590 [Hibiscus syriacus]|uniref:RNase H type-1 domain-containing protein n=1 Tax=Hibiscus syriacus TaxID=106335 RepID=A0A6A2ZYC9_HIBSY|nr:hypothetical protein F3Y22_tig00110637pilonHSYRG00590 [Hibiscus syriacus]
MASLWKEPPKEFLKYNVDGAIRGSFGLVGVGGILRDHEGKDLNKILRAAYMLDAELQATVVQAISRYANGDADALPKKGIPHI